MNAEDKNIKRKISSDGINHNSLNLNIHKTNFMNFFYKKIYTFKNKRDKEKEKDIEINIKKEKINKFKKDYSINKIKKYEIELRLNDYKNETNNSNNIILIKNNLNPFLNIIDCMINSNNSNKNSNIFRNSKNNNKNKNSKFINNFSKKNSILLNFNEKKLIKSNSINTIKSLNITNITDITNKNTPLIIKNKTIFNIDKFSFLENKNDINIKNNDNYNINKKEYLNSSKNSNKNISCQKSSSTNTTQLSHNLNTLKASFNHNYNNNLNNSNIEIHNNINKNEVINFSLIDKSLILQKKNSINDFYFENIFKENYKTIKYNIKDDNANIKKNTFLLNKFNNNNIYSKNHISFKGKFNLVF
jgi:hypothetical protein